MLQLYRNLLFILSFGIPLSLRCAQSTVDTSIGWDHSTWIGSIGESGATVGQTFTVPAGASRLDSFSFWVEADPFGPLRFGAYVAAWDVNHLAGPLLYESSLQTLMPDLSDPPRPPSAQQITFDTGGIPLVTGKQYMALVSTTEYHDGIFDQGRLGLRSDDVYSGGRHWAADNTYDFAALFERPWFFDSSGSDLVFQMEFANVPEPNSLQLMGSAAALWLIICQGSRMRRRLWERLTLYPEAPWRRGDTGCVTKPFCTGLIVLLALLGAEHPATTAPLFTALEAKLVHTSNGEGVESDGFGTTVALSGDGNTALVVATGPFWNNKLARAYVFVWSGTDWRLQGQLSTDLHYFLWYGGYFGSAASFSRDGNTVLLGASADIYAPVPLWKTTGSAYVFVRSEQTWSEAARLVASDLHGGDYFGCALSLSDDGNTVLIGAYGHDDPGIEDIGSAYVFVRDGTNWLQQAKLKAPDLSANAFFGFSVSLNGSGNVALIGANQDSRPGAARAGAAYVFARSGTNWTSTGKLTVSPTWPAFDYFGSSVSLSSDGLTALVGAPGDDQAAGTESGCAYVFASSGGVWGQQARLIADNPSAGARFGDTVSLSGDGLIALVGASQADPSRGLDAGNAYVFVPAGTNWSLQTSMVANDGAAGDRFGNAVALCDDGSTALIGAHLDDLTGTNGGAMGWTATNAGSAYVYRLNGPAYNHLAVEELGRTVRLWYRGTPGTNYVLDRTSSLTPPTIWLPEATNLAPVDGVLVITNTPASDTNHFWRMRAAE